MTIDRLKGLAELPNAQDELLRLLIVVKDGQPVLDEEVLVDMLVAILRALPGRADVIEKEYAA